MVKARSIQWPRQEGSATAQREFHGNFSGHQSNGLPKVVTPPGQKDGKGYYRSQFEEVWEIYL